MNIYEYLEFYFQKVQFYINVDGDKSKRNNTKTLLRTCAGIPLHYRLYVREIGQRNRRNGGFFWNKSPPSEPINRDEEQTDIRRHEEGSTDGGVNNIDKTNAPLIPPPPPENNDMVTHEKDEFGNDEIYELIMLLSIEWWL